MVRLEPVNGPPCSCGHRNAEWDVRINSRGVFLCRPCAAELKAALPEPIDHAAEVERLTHEISVMAHALEYPAYDADRMALLAKLEALVDEIAPHIEAEQ